MSQNLIYTIRLATSPEESRWSETRAIYQGLSSDHPRRRMSAVGQKRSLKVVHLSKNTRCIVPTELVFPRRSGGPPPVALASMGMTDNRLCGIVQHPTDIGEGLNELLLFLLGFLLLAIRR